MILIISGISAKSLRDKGFAEHKVYSTIPFFKVRTLVQVETLDRSISLTAQITKVQGPYKSTSRNHIGHPFYILRFKRFDSVA